MKKEILLEDFTNDSMMSYSAYVLLNRALPDFRDGLKPVQRRVISSMYINKNTSLKKSDTVTGRVMEIHPHGDTYGTVVNMVQKDRQNLPFLEGKGSWGHYTSKTHVAAAGRYTEVKLGKVALEMTKELKNESVNMVPNYDGTIMVPEVLPTTFPTILTHYNYGIGVGFASETLPYNIKELYNAIEKYLKTGEMDVLVPDFPTGANIIKNEEAFKAIWNEGRGSISIRAEAELSKGKIIIHQLPYGVKREDIIDKIIELSNNKKLPEVTDVRDGTSFKGMKIVIKIRPTSDPATVLEKLYLTTKLQSNASSNSNVIYNGYPVVMGGRKILHEWIKWRKQVISLTIVNSTKKKKEELHLLDGLSKVVDYLDDIIKIIRFEKEDEINTKLMEKYDLTLEQADYVSRIRLRNINKENLQKRLDNADNLRKEVAKLEANAKNEDFLNEELLRTMKQTIEKIDATDRRSKIIEIDKNQVKVAKKIKKEVSKAESYSVILTITKNGYLFKTNKAGVRVAKLRVDDEILEEVKLDNSDRIFNFLPNGEGGLLDIDEIDEKNGLYVPGYFERSNCYGTIVPKKDGEHVVIGYADGQVSRVPFESFIGVRRIVKNGYYNNEPVFIQQIPENAKGMLTIKANNKVRNVLLDNVNVKKGQISRGQNFLKPLKEGKIEYIINLKANQ